MNNIDGDLAGDTDTDIPTEVKHPAGAKRLLAGNNSRHPGCYYWCVRRPGGGFSYFRWEDADIQARDDSEYKERKRTASPSPSSKIVSSFDSLVATISDVAETRGRGRGRGRPRTNQAKMWPGQEQALRPTFSMNTATTAPTLDVVQFQRMLDISTATLRQHISTELEKLKHDLELEFDDLRDVGDAARSADEDFEPPSPVAPLTDEKKKKRKFIDLAEEDDGDKKKKGKNKKK